MAVSLNSVVGFNPTARYQHASRYSAEASARNLFRFVSHSHMLSSRRRRHLKWKISYSVSSSESTDDTSTADRAISAVDFPNKENTQTPSNTDDISVPTTADSNNGSSSTVPAKRASLTARERLRAARVLNRYTETTKASSNPAMGSKLLDVLKESDKKAKKRPGLPEAPTNLFDDSKRGMPKQGLTFDLPGGNDILIIAFSFVFISTVMFGTAYIVWKVGAIHFNEY